ncbi:MAG: radical SAM protein [Candidatus Omnitrophica bacterium]|nr:radical SAM protein [Candidatus Omnitrophota bacterium]
MLFINPVASSITQPKIVRKFTYASFPTSIGFLAASLIRNNKDNVRIIDEQVIELSKGSLGGELDRLAHPRMVGIPNLTSTTKRLFELVRMIKDMDPGVTVVLGGIHPTVLPEDVLMRSGADIVVRGEGELTVSELYECLKNEKDYSGLKGISYRRDTKVFHNPGRELIRDLDTLPPVAYELFEENIAHYTDFGTLLTSRGCPYNCIFCSQRAVAGNLYRFHSAGRILEEIGRLVDKYDQKKIWFVDDTIAVNKERLYKLLDGIIEKGYHKKTAFKGTIRGDQVTYDLLERLKAANFAAINIGVETGSDRLMKLIDKKEAVEDNIKAIKMCREAGILTDTTLIFGLPSETRKERYDTIKMMNSLPVDAARYNLAMPFPGTRFFEIAEKEGRLHIHKDWTNFSSQYYMSGDDVPYVPANTSSAVLTFDIIFANIAFYLRPAVIYKTFFNRFLAGGGGAFSLPKRWYLDPKTLLIFLQFAAILIKRIVIVSFNAAISVLTKKGFTRVNEREARS